MGEHNTEVIVKRCHSCLETENLAPCGGNVDGPCRNRNLLCPEHSKAKTMLGKIQYHGASEAVPTSQVDRDGVERIGRRRCHFCQV